MPFQSKAQERWAFATKQPFAKKWAGMTDQKGLPKKAHHSLEALKSAMKMRGMK